MASPQIENGHVEIATEIVEALMRINISAYESRVLWFIFRKTYGWKKKTDWITLSQFSKAIGIDRRLIHRAIKSLSSKEMIVINRDDNNRIRYGFQKNYDKWKVSSKTMTVINRDDKVSSKEMIRLSSKEIPTKETITKETIQKKKGQCPQQTILDLYYKILPEGTKHVAWDGERAAMLRARWNAAYQSQTTEFNSAQIEFWEGLFKFIRTSDFLMGRLAPSGGYKRFQISLEKIVKKKMFINILEGREYWK